MAQTNRRGNATRTLAPFAPLGLALLLGTAVIPGGGGGDSNGEPRGAEAAVCEDNIEGFRGCHNDYPTGCSKAGQYDATLNLFKNQLVPPSTAPVGTLGQSDFVNLEKNTPGDLTRGNHGDKADDLGKLGEGRVFAVNGYLYYAQKGGTSESSNCQIGDLDAIDYHIGIGFDASLAAKLIPTKPKTKLSSDDKASVTRTSIIVEMTPHYRAQFEPNWDLPTVQAAVGRQVRVIGQLIADNEHNNTKDNCSHAGANQASCWRLSIWELHPVTQFKVCNKTDGTACDPNTASEWDNLEDFTPPE